MKLTKSNFLHLEICKINEHKQKKNLFHLKFIKNLKKFINIIEI